MAITYKFVHRGRIVGGDDDARLARVRRHARSVQLVGDRSLADGAESGRQIEAGQCAGLGGDLAGPVGPQLQPRPSEAKLLKSTTNPNKLNPKKTNPGVSTSSSSGSGRGFVGNLFAIDHC